MPRHTLPSALLLLALAGSACPAAENIDLSRVTPVPADQPIPVQDFFRSPAFFNPRLNDASTHVAALFPATADTWGLVVVDLTRLDGKPLAVALPNERSIHAVEWLNDDRLTFRGFALDHWETSMFVADVSRALNYYPVLEGISATLVSAPDARELRPLYMMNTDIAEGNGRRGHVVEVNTDINLSATSDPELSGAGIQMMRNRNDRRIVSTFPDIGKVLETEYLADRAGELAFGTSVEDGVYRLYQLQGGAWKQSPIDLDQIEVVTCGEREGELIVRGPLQAGKPRSLVFMDATPGTPGELVLEDPGYDFHGWVERDPRTHQILGLKFDRGIPVTHWFTEEYRSVQKFLETNFPGKVVRMWPVDKTGNHVFLSVHSDRQPWTYYVADLEKRTLGLIKSTMPWLDPERMQPTSMFKFKTAEGARLDGYLTLPKGTSKERPAPLVVLPQEFRTARHTFGFDREAQFFASRGYAVLRPNTRGSVGTQWQFPYEDRWAFRKMADDVSAATRAVLKTGLIDPARVAIVGTEFGAYLAAGGVAFEPDLYRCAAVVSGTYDWASWIDEINTSRFDSPEYGELVRWLGQPRDQREKFDSLSVVRAMAQARGAVLVAYDKDASPSKANEARRLIDALKKNDLSHEVVTVTGLSPGWGHFNEKVELYERIAAFLQKQLASGAAPAK